MNYTENYIIIKPDRRIVVHGIASILLGVLLFIIANNRMNIVPLCVLSGCLILAGIMCFLIGVFCSAEITDDHISVRYCLINKSINTDAIINVAIRSHYNSALIEKKEIIVQDSNQRLTILCGEKKYSLVIDFLTEHGIEPEYEEPSIRCGEKCMLNDSYCKILTYRLNLAERVLPIGCVTSILLTIVGFFAEINLSCWIVLFCTFVWYVLFLSFHDVFFLNESGLQGLGDVMLGSAWKWLDIPKNKRIIAEIILSFILLFALVIVNNRNLVIIRENGVMYLMLILLMFPLANHLFGDKWRVLIAVAILGYLLGLSDIVSWVFSDYYTVDGTANYSQLDKTYSVIFEYEGKQEGFIWHDTSINEDDTKEITVVIHNDPFYKLITCPEEYRYKLLQK